MRRLWTGAAAIAFAACSSATAPDCDVDRDEARTIAQDFAQTENLDWGEPERIDFFETNGWVVFYATPALEFSLQGSRSIAVSCEGEALRTVPG